MEYTYFIYEGNTYNFVKEYEENEYDLTYTPIHESVCRDIMEMSKLVYAIYEKIVFKKGELTASSTSKKLILELEDFFKQYEPHDLSFWGMFKFKTLGDLVSKDFTYSIDNKTKELILVYENVTVYIPESYEGIWGIDSDGEYHCLDESNINDFDTLEIEYLDRFENNYYMSEDQLEENDEKISALISEICSIINKHGHELMGCGDLYNFYLKHL